MPRTIKAVDDGIKRHPLSLRTTKELRVKLERAALASGRSLAQEIEARLTQSFQDDLAGDGPNAKILRAAGNAIAAIEQVYGKTWYDEVAVSRRACNAAVAVIQTIMLPEGNAESRIEPVNLLTVMPTDPRYKEYLERGHQRLGEAIAREAFPEIVSAIREIAQDEKSATSGSASGPHKNVPSKTTRSETSQSVEK